MTFLEDKGAFIKKHGLYSVDTSNMDQYGRYHKEYICMDGAIFYEINSPAYETAIVEVHGVKFEVEVKLFKTECWDTDNAKSRFYYERF